MTPATPPSGFDRDLRDYRAPDAFALLTPDEAIGWLCVILAIGAVFAPYF